MVTENIRKPFKITYLLVGINVIVFALMWLSDSSLSTATLVKFGAKLSYKIVDGEWYRLFTVMFLHADLTHLLFNMVALLQLGSETEMIFGKTRFLIIYFISGLVGSLASFIWSPSVSVGASGAIFGLMGANLYLYAMNKEVYKRVFGYQMIGILMINLVYGLVNTSIDDSAHIGGLVGGFIATWAVGYKYQTQFNWRNYLARATLLVYLPAAFYLGTILTHESSNYYWYKAIFSIQEGNIDLAEATLESGTLLYPDNQDFSKLLSDIKTYKEEMNASKP